MELQAARIPRQPKAFEQATGLVFGGLHQGFVIQRVDGQRQHGLPVMHQAGLQRDHLSDGVEVGCELGFEGEVLAVDRQGDVSWIAAAPDDAGFGEEPCDQAEVVEVQGRLVDQAQGVRWRIACCRQQIVLGQRLKLGRCQRCCVCGPIRAEFFDHQGDVGQLTAAMGLWVGSDDLFGQSGATARHADDKNRSRVMAANALVVECAGAKCRNQVIDVALRCREIVRPRQTLAGGIGGAPMGHGGFGLASAIVNLAKRVAQQGAFAVLGGRLLHQCACACKQGFRCILALQRQQAGKRGGPARAVLQCLGVRVDRGGLVAGVFVALGQGQPQVRLGGCFFQGFQVEAGFGVEQAQAIAGFPQSQASLEIFGPCGDHLLP